MGKEDLIGLTLGECEILKKLGSGGMGTVYLADHKTLDMLVAVKVLDEELNEDAEFIERFKREAQQTARLEHPNIMRIFGVSEAKGLHFMVSAYIDGPTLETMLKSKVLSEEKAIFYILQVLSGLDYAHRDNIIHRDIKPSNIMINRNDDVKITDFGLVRSLDTDVSITKTGVPLGTPAFMSPEQWENKDIDQRADIFSVAVTLYKLLSNKYPFEGNSSIGIYRAISAGDSIPITRWQPDIAPELERILQKGMRPNKDTRFQTAYEFGVALKKYLLKNSDTPSKFLSLYPYDVIDDKYRDSTDFSHGQLLTDETKTQFGKSYESVAKQEVTPITPPLSPFYDPVAHDSQKALPSYQPATPDTPSRFAQTPATPMSQTPMLNEVDVKNLATLNRIIKFRKFGLTFALLIFFLLLGNLIGSHKTRDEKQNELTEVTAFVKAQIGSVKDCEAYIQNYPNGIYIEDAIRLKKQKELAEINQTKENDPRKFLKQTSDGWILNGPLTLDNGVHCFPGKFIISSEGVLKIPAGTTMEFDKSSSIVCYGVIKANGRPGNPVKFTAKDSDEGWKGIAFIGSESSDSYLEHCIFSYGRGVPLHNQSGIVTFIDFDTESQTHYGGAMVIFNRANIKLANCSFINNQSSAGGGAVLCSGARPQFITCSFLNNKVNTDSTSSKGGAIYIQGESVVEFLKCQFRQNQAVMGGALYAEHSYPSVYDSFFEENGIKSSDNAESFGGAICLENQCGIRLIDSKFSKNTATLVGGAICINSSESIIISNEFTQNSVLSSSNNGMGGGVYLGDKTRTIVLTSNFENNECNGLGGALFFGENAQGFIQVTYLLGNKANTGAGIYLEKDVKLSINSVKIMRNTASEKAGGIYVEKNSKVYSEETEIVENTPDQVVENE